jgi:hypothetical protein
MAPVKLLAMLALALVTPAAAQVMRVPVIAPVGADQVKLPPAEDVAKVDTVAADPEQARKTINQLRREKRELNQKLTEALARIDEMTRRGGSLVSAYCESPSVSRNTAGATENCGAYRCGEVDGLCRKTCNVTTDCAGYHVCDTAAHVCVRA